MEELKKIIQAANPEIMELKFGCEMEDSQYGIGQIYFNDGEIISAFFPDYNGRTATFTYQIPLTDIHIKKILGHPIRLVDVLMAIYKMRTSKESVFVRQDGVIFRWEKFTEGGNGHHGVVSTYIEWNLLDDNLDKQSPECIKFLTELLIK